MKLSVFYEHQCPQPWGEDTERKLLQESLAQVELADKLGFDCAWATEHHFLEECSHSTAPEVFLAACSQRTKRIRLGHAVSLAPPQYNHPARVAERLATLDLLSDGRVEWGSGESGTLLEMAGFGVDVEHKAAAWRECVEHTAHMMAMRPYPGHEGQFFSMPARNVVPKPMQKPHPPLWMACSRRDSILRAARHGVGALVFGFVTAEQAKTWRDEYYAIIKSEECVPIGHAVNANFATLNGMMVHPDYDEARRRSLDGFKFFGYCIAHYAIYGVHKPGVTNLWEQFQAVRDKMPESPGSGSIGSPRTVRDHLQSYADVGVDQMIFMQQGGKIEHDHICESLDLFARDVMPALKERDEERERKKAEELAPYIAAAMARKQGLKPLAPDDVPEFEAAGLILERRAAASGGPAVGQYVLDPTRGGAIPMAPRSIYPPVRANR
ncbi:MAG: LLM class flavin-dependent oxidoreductase [Rhodospirillaceae bacterium]|nr:LLM class flavin-dependent oxidoreductase [Rhodospirillaceae bacterium]